MTALSIRFDRDATTTPEGSKADLDALVQRLTTEEDIRIQLVAYAAAGSEGPSQARRISLSRALSVRTALIDRGVRSTRIDVRALGDKTDRQPVDRVDLILTKR